MKNMKWMPLFFALLGLMVFATGCSKSKGGGGNAYNQNRYYMTNGMCIDRYTNQSVNTQYCSNSGTGRYQWYNNQCIDTQSNNTVVDASYCNTANNNRYVWYNNACYDQQTSQQVDPVYCNSTVPGQGGTGGQCYGWYYYMMYGYPNFIQCYGYNCRGYTLYSYQTSTEQHCQ